MTESAVSAAILRSVFQFAMLSVFKFFPKPKMIFQRILAGQKSAQAGQTK